jgi:hypothetical protein
LTVIVARVVPEETKSFRSGAGEGAGGRGIGMEIAVGKLQVIGGADVQGRRHIDDRPHAEGHPRRVDEKEIGSAAGTPGSSFSKPLIVDNCPPVTREMTLLAGPLIVNTAPSPFPTLNFEKLWKTLPPARCP